MNFIESPEDASPQQARATEAMNALLVAMQPPVMGMDAEWDGFAVMFTLGHEGGHTSLERIDPFFYALAAQSFVAELDPAPLEEYVVEFVEAAAGGAGFEKAVAVFTYRRDTRQIGVHNYWDSETEPYAVNADASNISTVAALCDPFTIQG